MSFKEFEVIGYPGPPTGTPSVTFAHKVFDIVIDSQGVVWVCTVAGHPGTWVGNGGLNGLTLGNGTAAGATLRSGSGAPSAQTFTSAQGDMWFRTDGAAGTFLYGCTVAGTPGTYVAVT